MNIKPVLQLSRIAIFPTVMLLLTACASYEPYEFHPIDEIPEGPGLLSGEDGEFILFRR